MGGLRITPRNLPGALRRIVYKITVDGPSQAHFLTIFAMIAKKKGVPWTKRPLST